jgi:hypothetical protein
MKKIILLVTLLASQVLFAQVQLPATFELDQATYALTDFGGTQSAIVVDPTDATNNVVRTVKTASAETWAGTTLAQGIGFTSALPFTNGSTTMSVRVWSPDAGIKVRLKVENKNDPTVSVETEATTTIASQWETLVFNFANEATGTAAINFASTYDKASIFFNFGVTGSAAGEKTYYWDDVTFVGTSSGEDENGNGNGGGNGGGSEPSTIAPIDFEAGGNGAEWTWTVFENNTNPPLEIVNNPDISGINTSASVAKFTALQAGNPWAGVESAHGDTDLGSFVLDATNSVIKIMVWKSVISDVGMKLVAAGGWAEVEIKVANTVVNQWEELTFDFSGRANPPASEGPFDQIVIFPDFNLTGRTQDNVVYFDHITFNAIEGSSEEPAGGIQLPITFEDMSFDWTSAFTNFDGGVVTTIDNPDKSMFNNSNRVGKMVKNAGQPWGGAYITLGHNLDLANNPEVSVTVWAPRANTTLLLKIENSANPAQNFEVNKTIPLDAQWTELTFDLGAANPANSYDRIVLIFDLGTVGDGSMNFTWLFDTIRYTSIPTSIEENSTELPSAVRLDQNYPNPFNPTTVISYQLPETEMVRLAVYDVLGREVALLVNTQVPAGTHMVSFDGSGLSSGIYLYRLQANNQVLTGKMMLMK